MQQQILGLRDPHAFITQEILALGFDDQSDQPLLDAVNQLTRSQALLIFHTLDMYHKNQGLMSQEDMSKLLLSSKDFIIVGNQTIQ